MSLLVTGATGFLGREVVRHVLDHEPESRLTLLVRGRDAADARRRGESLVGELVGEERRGAALSRVEIVAGDIERERLGLDAAGWDRLAATTTAVIHGAASVSFTLPIDQARKINVEGTRRVLDLARAARARVDYVGTAYVAGERRGIAHERELDVGQSFRNTYEQTKMEAEALVQARWGEQAIAVFRPSIIVGDSRTGRTASFKVLYWPLRLYARGLVPFIPGRPSTPVDVVPSDYVVEALMAIRRSEVSLGRAYHLAAGVEHDSTLGELIDLAAGFFAVRRPPFVRPERILRFFRPFVDHVAWGEFKRRMIAARVYTPYLNLDLRFDTRGAREALVGTGIAVPPVRSYFATLLRYCVETEWGRRPEQAAAG